MALLGKYDLKTANEVGAKKALVWDIAIHDDWNFNDLKFDADISIVILSETVELNDGIRLVCLPTSSDEEVASGPADVIGTVVGWGKSENSNSLMSTPNELHVPAINSSHCYTTYDKLATISSNRMFCGGFENQDKAPCLGDSGSGFYIFEPSTDTWNVRGIVSASYVDLDHGCDISMYSLYTNVAKFTDWITKVLSETREIIWKEIDFVCMKAKG